MLNFTWLSDEDEATLQALAARDWTRDALTLGVVDDEQLAARAVALGAVAFHGFGNFYAISTHPDSLVVRYVNLLKARPLDQVGSVTTTREHLADLFDWSQVPAPLSQRTVTELMDTLLERGPFGFRGPAAASMPAHLTAMDGSTRTTQVISGGYGCPANAFLARCLEEVGQRYLYTTSANRSRHATGNADEPPHFTLRGLQEDFGAAAGVLILAHADERQARRAYPRYAPNSTTILAFHRIGGTRSRPALRIERHGSLHVDDVRPIVAELGFDLELGPNAQQRLPVRSYEVQAA
ncbi:MAG TPA: hypothetical protein VGL99_02270 [Chloroflexota bacterium]|jgi:hypothetical protein